MHPPSVTGLYWSIRGEVSCAEHAPSTNDPRLDHRGMGIPACRVWSYQSAALSVPTLRHRRPRLRVKRQHALTGRHRVGSA